MRGNAQQWHYSPCRGAEIRKWGAALGITGDEHAHVRREQRLLVANDFHRQKAE
jgi:hypothetical protein